MLWCAMQVIPSLQGKHVHLNWEFHELLYMAMHCSLFNVPQWIFMRYLFKSYWTPGLGFFVANYGTRYLGVLLWCMPCGSKCTTWQQSSSKSLKGVAFGTTLSLLQWRVVLYLQLHLSHLTVNRKKLIRKVQWVLACMTFFHHLYIFILIF